MKRFTKFACMTVLGATLAGCGGSFEEDLLDQAEEYDNRVARVDRMTPSGAQVVNNSRGTARFSGNALIVAGSQTNRSVLVGDANVTVNFSGQTAVRGSITNVAGAAGVNEYVQGSGRLDDYNGSLTLSNGSVGTGNQVEVDYAGTLRGNGDTLVIGGTMEGEFLGNPSVRALDMIGVDLDRVNGSPSYIGVRVVAERDN